MEADSNTEGGLSPPPSPVPPPPVSGVCGEGRTKVSDGKEDSDDEDDEEDTSRGAWGLPKSKWDDDASFQRLGEIFCTHEAGVWCFLQNIEVDILWATEQLDGLKRRLHHSNSSSTLSMAEFLKDEASQFRRRKEGVKRVSTPRLNPMT